MIKQQADTHKRKEKKYLWTKSRIEQDSELPQQNPFSSSMSPYITIKLLRVIEEK